MIDHTMSPYDPAIHWFVTLPWVGTGRAGELEYYGVAKASEEIAVRHEMHCAIRAAADALLSMYPDAGIDKDRVTAIHPHWVTS